MIQLGLSSRDRKTLLVGAVSVALTLVIGKGVPALRRWDSSRVARAAELHGRLTKAEYGAKALGAMRDSAAARKQRLGIQASSLLLASSPEAAAADLASLIEDIAGENGLDVFTVTLKPDSAARNGLARISVSMSSECDVRGLLDFLYEIETGETPMLVRELAVSQPDPLAPTSKAEALRVDLVVQTLARIQTGISRSAGR